MKCYYEELGIARDALEGDIKTAYRKLALRWHPDKNLQNLDEAKERFQLIQQAYDVLSDAQERAWYDNHREQILRGKNSDYEENCLDVFQYFTVSCYKGYGDDSKGFYAVYREVFEKIVAEDAEFMEDEEKIAEIPSFGDSQSSYEEVVGPFYAFWQAYCTKKTYTWLCPYDIKEIKDRRVLREIEKELKKLAQKAKKERNEEVRNLVSFIRKRDKRVQAYKVQLEERAALNRQKQEQNRLEQIRKRQRELEEMRQVPNHFNDNYEKQLKELESHYNGEISDEDDEDEMLEVTEEESETEIEYYDHLYCVACNKAFKNERAYLNHESSKKHRENVERIKQDMLEEEEAFKSASDVEVENINGEETHEEEQTVLSFANEEEPKQSKKNKKNKKSKSIKSTVVTSLNSSDLEDDFQNLSIHADDKDNSDTENWNSSNKKSAKKNKNKKHGKSSSDNKQNNEELKNDLTTSPIIETENISELAATNECATCNTKFDSKNKLFAHLKKTNHSVYLPKAKTESPEVNPKKGKGRKK